MAIRKEKNGTYTVDINLTINRKYVRTRKKGIKSKKEAQELEAKIRNDKEFNPKKELKTFKEIYLKYIDYCKIEIEKGNMRTTTIDSKKSIFDTHILPFFNKTLIENITKEDILNFQKELSKTKNVRNSNQNLANGTLRKIYKQLNAFFEYCFQEEYITVNPCNKVNNFKKEKKEKEYLTIEEFYSLIANIKNERDQSIINLLFFSGVRISELLGLGLNQINLNNEDSYIKIANTCHKGEIREYAKTDDSQDIIYINETTKNILIKYINSDEFKSYNSNYLFPSRESKCGILSERAVGDMIKKYCKQADINKHITPHSFRHSHVAMLMDMGMNLEDIKDRVRHSSIKTTSDEYGHMYNSRKKELVLNIENYVNSHKNVNI